MRILYDATDGKIFYAVYDRDWFAFSHTTNVPLTEIIIDELDPANKTICFDLVKTQNKVDDTNEGKYYVDASGALMEKAGWVERVPEVI